MAINVLLRWTQETEAVFLLGGGRIAVRLDRRDGYYDGEVSLVPVSFEGARPWPLLSGSVGLGFDATKSWKRFLVLLPFRRHPLFDSVDHSVFFASLVS